MILPTSNFAYEGTIVRLRLIPNFPSHALANLHPEAEWAAQLLMVSRYFCTPDGEWMRCADEDSNPEDPDIYIEQVVGGVGPITLKGPKSKDIISARVFLSNDFQWDYHCETVEPQQVVYQCEDIYTKQVKNKPYLRRTSHIEKFGRLLWNMKRSAFVELIPNCLYTVGEAVDMERLANSEARAEGKQLVS